MPMATAVASTDLDALCAFDTPTICNALEIAAPERRAFGFNRPPLLAPLPGAKPVVGYARARPRRQRPPAERPGAGVPAPPPARAGEAEPKEPRRGARASSQILCTRR